MYREIPRFTRVVIIINFYRSVFLLYFFPSRCFVVHFDFVFIPRDKMFALLSSAVAAAATAVVNSARRVDLHY